MTRIKAWVKMDKEILAALLRIIILLPLICGLAYITVKFGLGAKYLPVHGRRKRMRLVEQVSLGPKCGLSLVQVGDKYLLLAHQEGSIVVVREMDDLPAAIETELPGRPGSGVWLNYLGPFGDKQKK
jgi:flagellar protein FliO/FliZ